MSDDFTLKGAEDLSLLAKRLKDAGRNDLRKELMAGVRKSGLSTVRTIRESALENLPRRGGLAAKVAAEKATVSARYSGSAARVSLRRKRGRGLNAGRLRHPVFGNTDVWVQQKVPSEWFDDPIRDAAPEIRRGIQQVMEDIAAKIARSPL